MERGITVISWDSGVAKEGRQMHLNPSSSALIGNTIIKLAADNMPDGGDVAILSATSTSTNQNVWIEEAKKVLPNYPGINLVATVYGDDLADKSYREAQGLIATYPNPVSYTHLWRRFGAQNRPLRRALAAATKAQLR